MGFNIPPGLKGLILGFLIGITFFLFTRKKKRGYGLGKQSGRFGLILRSQLTKSTRDAFKLKAGVAAQQNVNLPEQYDLRDAFPDAMADVLNQKSCGSCWAFAITSFLSDRIRMVSPRSLLDANVLVDGDLRRNQLSPYLLAGCDFCDLSNKEKTYLANADELRANGKCSEGSVCSGNSLEYGLIFAQENGLITTVCNDPVARGTYSCQPREPLLDRVVVTENNVKHHCHLFKFGAPVLISIHTDDELTDFENLQANERAIMTEIFLNGSVCSGFMVHENFSDFFEKNPRGVYSSTKDSKEEGGHATTIIGWGEENKIKYWICRNSWGRDWGDKGYFKILRGSNFCQIESGVYAALPDKNWLDYTVNFEINDQRIPKLY